MKHKPIDSFIFRAEYYNFFKTLPLGDFVFCMESLCDFAFNCVEIPQHHDPLINQKLKEFSQRVDDDIYEYQIRRGLISDGE